MKYLFIVQGEGRGHLTQALALADMLRRHGHDVPEVLVGKSTHREVPSFFVEKIKSRVRTFDTPSLDYGKSGKKGRIGRTILLNVTPFKLTKWRKSIEFLNRRIEKTAPDVVVNFYEMMTGIAYLWFRIEVPMVSIAHQFLINHPDYAHRSTNDQAQFILRLNNMLCSLGTTKTLALSFYPLKDYYRERMAVLPPLLRSELKAMQPHDKGYLLGYMLNTAYIEEVRSWRKTDCKTNLHLFWDKKDAPEEICEDPCMTIHRISDRKFLTLMEQCSGYVSTAGFESICEAMYLGKPVMMVPSHIEQEINASDAAASGAGIVADQFDLSKLIDYIPHHLSRRETFKEWVDSAEAHFVRHLTTLV